jgi:DNA-binding response OmpR family regulator
MVAFILTASNCKVMLPDSDGEALHLAQTNHFDLYLLDNWIVGGSRIALCKKLREFDATTPILFYSGAAYESDKQEALASGAQAYLVKPVDIDELVETVRRLAEAKSASGTLSI